MGRMEKEEKKREPCETEERLCEDPKEGWNEVPLKNQRVYGAGVEWVKNCL